MVQLAGEFAQQHPFSGTQTVRESASQAAKGQGAQLPNHQECNHHDQPHRRKPEIWPTRLKQRGAILLGLDQDAGIVLLFNFLAQKF
jgi:hypothetical protein